LISKGLRKEMSRRCVVAGGSGKPRVQGARYLLLDKSLIIEVLILNYTPQSCSLKKGSALTDVSSFR
jgi:hypothetical protein